MANILQQRFDYVANELIKVARYSSAYLLDDIECKNGYLREINEVIRLIRNDLKIAMYNYEEGRFEYWKDAKKCVKEIEMELETEEYGYEQLRKKDKKSYLKTQEYSGKGYIFYGKNTLTIVGGIVQFGLGRMTFKMGKSIKSKELKNMGALGIITGGNSVITGATNIAYEFTDGEIDPINPAKFLTEEGFLALGAEKGTGELAYDLLDFGVSMYFGFAVLSKYDKPKRIIHLPLETKGGLQKVPFLDKLFTEKGVRLYRWAASDLKRKILVTSKPMLIYKAGNASIKGLLLIDKYFINYGENENN